MIYFSYIDFIKKKIYNMKMIFIFILYGGNMVKENKYKTKQRSAVIEYIEANKDKQITVNDILTHFNLDSEKKVSQTTIYRCLDSLVKEGKIKKSYSEKISASCYQYIEKSCKNHYHLKCEKCGEIFHIEQDILSSLENNIGKSYNFKIDNVWNM